MWWGIYTSLCYKFPTESNSERILKIGKYLVKLWARVRCLVFLTHSVYIIIIPASLVATDKGSAGSLSTYLTTDLPIDYATNILMETSSMSNMTASDHVRRLSPICVSCPDEK